MRYEGSCHCGKIAVAVAGDFAEAIDSHCSLCRRRGGLLAFIPRDRLTMKTPETDLSTYLFNKHVIRHHFCDSCGIAPFGEGEGPHGKMAAINLRCLPEFDLEAVKIVKYDGRSV
ncbi:GFA family protein [Ensifer sp. SSB1]|uniref:GFA family protein n=1 Tax=Ensifer sp. SSB1 TaxID=2795385 RepID=UPI001A520BE6|nr:GFA family protein [Ensifer sp. SSB1]MBK5571854.1 GFA family protein [Ensifer sp. SSB1]